MIVRCVVVFVICTHAGVDVKAESADDAGTAPMLRRTFYTWKAMPSLISASTTAIPVKSPSPSPSMSPTVVESSWPSMGPSCLSSLVEDASTDPEFFTQDTRTFSGLRWSLLLISVLSLVLWLTRRRQSNKSASEALVVAALCGDERDLRVPTNKHKVVAEIELTDFTKRYVEDKDPCDYATMSDEEDELFS